MGQLHELLAAEPDVKVAAQRALSSVMNLFQSGQSKFVGHIKTYRPLDEFGETFPDEEQVVATSVSAELGELEREFGKWINLALQKETTNTTTGALLEIGETIVDLPATALLNIESKLAKLREVYTAIPTLDPSRQWRWNGNTGQHETPPVINYKTEKVPLAITGYEATPEHPAQVQWFNKDVRIGEYTQTLFSKAITTTQKNNLLKRLDELIIMVKQARQRANQATVIGDDISKALFDYINQDL